MMKRLFFAIELDDRLRDQLANELRRLQLLGVSGTFTRPDNLHLTLQFIGEIEERHLNDLTRILHRTVCACRLFALQFSGLGSFGHNNDILWLGVREQPELDFLRRNLTAELAAAGLPHETRPFRPHLTLVRQARYRDDQIWQEKTTVLSQKVTAISLMESTRSQGVLRYLAIARQDLLVESEQSC